MPSQITHLTIAKKFIQKNQGTPTAVKDWQRFYMGTILPDIDRNKARSHCGVRQDRTSVVKWNAEKVNPEKFRAEHDMQDELNKAWYLHLYVDYQYYNVFLLSYYAQSDFDQSSIDMYEVTQRDDAYLSKKYQVSYQETGYSAELDEINAAWEKEHRQLYGYDYQYHEPYSIEELEKFIEEMANLRL